MIFFGWKKILRHAGYTANNIVAVLDLLATARLPKSKRDPIYKFYGRDFTGQSYLLNPLALLANRKKWTPKEIAEYIGLASFRSYPDYVATGDPTLALTHSPVQLATIKTNRLLRIVGDKIHFLYEDEEAQRTKELKK